MVGSVAPRRAAFQAADAARDNVATVPAKPQVADRAEAMVRARGAGPGR
ncbi:hypothetical protein [Actinomadura roseirufa]|nr:hypothetical protein [Actinomadura roseirufa]